MLSGTGDMAVIPTNGAFRFQSDLTDAATGQVDMLARLYEPVLGRFSSRDPLLGEPAVPLSLNQYVYGLSSPVTYDDPTGLCADPDICPPQVGFGTTQTHSHEFVRQIDQAGDKFEVAHKHEPAPRSEELPPATVFTDVIFNEDLPFEMRLDAAQLFIEVYGDVGIGIVEQWLAQIELESEDSWFEQLTKNPKESFLEGSQIVSPVEILKKTAQCIYTGAQAAIATAPAGAVFPPSEAFWLVGSFAVGCGVGIGTRVEWSTP